MECGYENKSQQWIEMMALPDHNTGDHLHMCPANKRRRYIVTLSLIGWAHIQIDPCNTIRPFMVCYYDYTDYTFVRNYYSCELKNVINKTSQSNIIASQPQNCLTIFISKVDKGLISDMVTTSWLKFIARAFFYVLDIVTYTRIVVSVTTGTIQEGNF